MLAGHLKQVFEFVLAVQIYKNDFGKAYPERGCHRSAQIEESQADI
jgi:hypothetical protein